MKKFNVAFGPIGLETVKS